MAKLSNEPARPWRVIANEISQAKRGDRILELAEELERAFKEQVPGSRKSPQVSGSEKQMEQRKQS